MPQGPLMIIGGAEDKLRKRTILHEFVRAAGGLEARIAVIPAASSIGSEITEVYDALFRREGAADVVAVRPESRQEAHDPQLVAAVEEATGVFMTGGNQLKLSAIVSGTPLGDAIVAAHHRGVVVGGTSAGASIQSSHMLAFGGPGATPKQRMTQMAAGLGLINSAVIDQHFDQRNRYGRLLMIVAQSPQLLGIGVDEDTAAIVEPDHQGHEVLRVIGRGSVTVMDPANIVTNAHEAKRSIPSWRAAWCCTCCPPGRSSTSPRVRCSPRRPRSPPRTPPSSPLPPVTCAGWPATSRPPTPRQVRCADVSPAADAGPRSRPRPGRSDAMSTRPTPDLTITETRVYRGPNIWSYDKAIHLVVDLGSLEEYPTNTIPGFTDTLLEMLPGLREHSCSRGKRGGFVERLDEGTWLGHVAEHAALALEQVVGHDIRRGKTRGVKGQKGVYNVIFGYADEQVGLAAARLAVRLVNHLVEADPEFDLDEELERFSARANVSRSARRPRRSSTRRCRATSPGSG